ncbi:MAG: hypothetical protein IT293_17775 [Deltaproteobacteria bacterium]|nr:hypothetical protein [Deltaproteobacteria bacterium]
MRPEAEAIEVAVRRLVDDYRDRCLWSLRADYYPATETETLRVLDYIERHGDRAAFMRAGEIRGWLSPSSALDFDGEPPDAAVLSHRWHLILDSARAVVKLLPPAEAGRCVLNARSELFRGTVATLREALEHGGLRFHPGSLRGSLPRVVS